MEQHKKENKSLINSELKKICAINRETVHKICSGQVVLNLAVAVKELVENAIDAGATNIDIRLKEYGSELLEVSDNGSGVEEQNFAALTLKHFTSKLREFSDLESVSTLGFRGEALSSLCALSNLTITTRHKSVEYATKIEYDNGGHIKKKLKCARQTGTTVTLTNLFSSLPVRHKEFIKNLKREFSKMCQLLYAYCLIAEGVRISCSNQAKKGTRTNVVATQGSKTIKENIICVFGIKQLESLTEIKMHEPDEKYLEDYGIKRSVDSNLPFTFEGYISKCTHGSGRSTSDRQFYFINSRPCEPNKIMKVVNEVYKYYNSSQYPFVFLNIKTAQSQIDVNVTPDKRQIFMEEEKLLLATLKTSLLEIFKQFPSTFKMQNLNVSTSKLGKENDKKPLSQTLKDWAKTTEKILDKSSRGIKRTTEESKGVMGFIFEKRLKIADDFSQDLSADSASEDEEKQLENFIKESYNHSDSEPDFSEISPPKTKVKKLINPFVRKSKEDFDQELKCSLQDFIKDRGNYKITENSTELAVDILDETIENKKQDIMETIETNERGCYKITFESPVVKKIDVRDIEIYERRKQSSMKTNENETNNEHNVTIKSEDSFEDMEQSYNDFKTSTNTSEVEISKYDNFPTNSLNNSKNNMKPSSSEDFTISQNSVVDLDIPNLQEILNKIRISNSGELTQNQVKFRSEITSKDAESELDRHISKDMFKRMDIVGQFNKGFIIAKLDSDLFIIDQHATDEKYNFETLQRTTVLQNQQLVVPKRLELTAANELLLIDNLEIFKKNGFAFEIDENAEPRYKVKLTAMPVSKNWEFGKEAIDELLFMLQEDSGTENMRPSGIRSMFASRACRKSVMIGHSLTISDMRKLVDHMGQIEHPWNCPHGRPTMRHLINLDLINTDDSNSEEEEEDNE